MEPTEPRYAGVKILLFAVGVAVASAGCGAYKAYTEPSRSAAEVALIKTAGGGAVIRGVDGKSTSGGFVGVRGIEVLPGRHALTVEYDAPLFTGGKYVSLSNCSLTFEATAGRTYTLRSQRDVSRRVWSAWLEDDRGAQVAAC